MAEMNKPINEQTEEQKPIQGVLDVSTLLHDMVRGLRKYWYILLALVAVMAAFGIYKSAANYVPLYRCDASFTVTAQESGSGSSSAFFYDKATASQMASTFPYLVQSDLLKDLLKQDLGVRVINGSITASSVAETNLFTLTVTSRSPQDAKAILESVIKNYPRVSAYVMGDIQLNMIDPPVLPKQPYNQRSWMDAAVKNGLMGLLLGIGLLALYALNRNTIRKETELENKLNQPCFGMIHQVSFKKRTGKVDTTLSIFNDRTGVAFQEGFRSIALRTASEMQEDGTHVLGVTSTISGEGTTTVAKNLAMALGESGKKVILLDAHFERGQNKSDRPGLESFLDGTAKLSDILVRDPKARIWTVGCRRKMTALELSGCTAQLHALVDGAKSVVDFVILDLPACQHMSEAAPGLELCEGLLYVIKQDTVKSGRIMDTIEDLSRYDAKLYGCVLNCTQGGLGGYGYGYGYNYSRYGYYRYGRYGYGYGYGYGANANANTSTKKEP